MSENNYRITIGGSFLRSRRLDTDKLDAGYVLLGTGRQALEVMASNISESRQRAFTWTGPYGCGKSSLALLLAALVGEPNDRARALSLVGEDPVIAKGFSAAKGWKIVRLVGRQASLTQDIAKALKSHRTINAIGNALERLAENAGEQDGVLVMIDELGKYLEADCASENTYLLQELAELACRSKHRIVLLGILHQAMDVYASRLPLGMRDEWAKVQGRFIDIPLVGTTDETLELLSRAIVQPESFNPGEAFENAVSTAASWMATNTDSDRAHTEKLLVGCWPLNPIVSLMLGPVSRRKFSQNERSIYSFLSAREPSGFAEFLERENPPAQYTLARFWDYLQANFETAILATSDAHRWLTAVDAVNRAESKLTPAHIRLAKAVAVIDLFRSGSRLQASADILSAAVCEPVESVLKELQELVQARVLVERRHAGAWAVFAGSDFDLEAAMREASSRLGAVDAAEVSKLVNLNPIVCRDHYYETGTMRWFNRRLASAESLGKLKSEKFKDDGSAGEMFLLLPSGDEEIQSSEGYLAQLWETHRLSDVEQSKGRILVLGVPANARRIVALAQELQAVNLVANDPVLEGDATGRSEVNIRRSTVRQLLTDELTKAFLSATWYANRETRVLSTQAELTEYLSRLCSLWFSASPRIVNELINRDNLSGNIVRAQKSLLAAMLAHGSERRLGFTGFPPEYGLYVSLLTSLHSKAKPKTDGEEEVWGFQSEPRKDMTRLSQLWRLTEEFLKNHEQVTAAEIYTFWRKPPFGMKEGPMPTLLFAYLLGNSEKYAVYDQGVFLSEITQKVIDDLTVDPSDISLRYVDRTGGEELLAALADVLKKYAPEVTPDALSIGRAIVRLVFTAPAWAKRTQSLSEPTLKMRKAALKASDPIDFILREIPGIFSAPTAADTAQLLAASLDEFLNAAPVLYDALRQHLCEALQADSTDWPALNERAKAIKGLSGNISQEAFVTRMAAFTGTDADVIGLWNLAAGKPINMCSDLVVKECLSKIDQFAFAFRQQEAFASLRGRNAARRVLSVAIASGGKDITCTVELSAEKAASVHQKALSLVSSFKGMDTGMVTAVLAELGTLVFQERQNAEEQGAQA